MLGSMILAGACAAIAAGAAAGPAARLGELAPVEVVDWTGAEPFASVFADRDRPVVLRATRYAAESSTRRWTVEHLAKTIPGGVLENAKRYPAAPGTPMFATGMPMATVPELMAHYAPHFSRHDLPLQQFFDYIGVSPEAAPSSDGDSDGDRTIDDADAEAPAGVDDAEAPAGTCDMVDGCTEAETAGAVSDADLGLRSDDVSKLGLQASQPAGSVFASSTPASGRPRFSYAGMLREWGPWLEKDLELDALVPTVTGDAITVKPYVWMGQGGTVTPCHYDYYQNFYLQLQGKKHFAIFPPAAHAALHLHPAVHPAHRSSQLSFPTFPRAANPANPAPGSDGAGAGGIDGWEVVLEPGDILFLPAMYFHHVTTLGKFALSTNVWSEYTPASHHGESLQVQLPFVADLAGSERADFVDDEHGALKAQIMRAYINLVLEDMVTNLTAALAGRLPGDGGGDGEGGDRAGDGGGDVDDRGDSGDNDTGDASTTGNTGAALGGIQRWIKHHLLDRRHKWYSHAVVVDGPNSAESPTSRSGDGTWPRFCNDPDFLAGFVSDDGGFALHMLQATVQEVESIITEIQSTTDAARFEIIMLNWVERVATDVVGPRYVAQFLSDLVHC